MNEEITLELPEQKILLSECHNVLCGYQVRHCDCCGISQPFEIIAMHEKPDLEDRIDIDGIRYSLKDNTCPDYSPEDNPEAFYLGVCLLCKTPVEITSVPDKVDYLWEDVDGYHTLRRLTTKSTDKETHRVLSEEAASILFDSTKGHFFKWFLSMSVMRGFVLLISVVLFFCYLSLLFEEKPIYLWLGLFFGVLVFILINFGPKLLQLKVGGNPLTAKLRAKLLPYAIDIPSLYEYSKTSFRYSIIANALKPLARAYTKQGEENEK